MHSENIQVPRRQATLPRAVVVTVLLLSVAWALRWVPLPLVDASLVPPRVASMMKLGVFGLGPLISGFLLVELFSFSPPGRRWREAGVAGRARLNRAALVASLAVAAIQAIGLVRALEPMMDPSGTPLVAHPGAAFEIVTVATFIAAAAGLFALATAIGEWGIGNGFCWLTVLGFLETALRAWRPDPGRLGRAEPIDLVFGALWIVPFFILAGAIELRRVEGRIATAAGEEIKLPLPPLPQGIWPAGWAEAGIGIAAALGAWLHLGWLSGSSPLLSLAFSLLLVPAFSLLTFAWFGTRRRLAANLLPAATVGPEIDKTIDRQFVSTTLVLTGGEVALLLLHWLIPASPAIGFSAVFVLTAIALDVRDELAFVRRYGRTARLLQLDNVHLAAYLRALLGQRGIAAVARAHRFRSLYYWLFPLVKIDLLVPAESAEAAAAVIAEQELRRV